MPLIIGLLLLFIILCAKGNEKIQDGLYNMGIKSSKKKWDEWVEKATDSALEEELEQFLYEHPEEAKEKARAICPAIPEWASEEDYMRALLAEHGKIRLFDAMDPEVFGIEEPECIHQGETTRIRRQLAKNYATFLFQISNALSSKGLNNHIILKNMYPVGNNKSVWTVEEVIETGCGAGTYCIMPD